MTRPDHARIAELEAELGIAEPEPPRPPVIPTKICLTKNCQGDDEEIYTWRHSVPIRILHTCRKPT